MNTELNPNLPFLSVKEIGDLTSALDATHTRTIKTIARLQNDIDAQKASIANRWKTAHIDQRDSTRIQAQELKAVILEIRKNSEKELDGLFREAGASHAKIVAQRMFYESPVRTLARAGLGSQKRSDYLQQLQGAGSSEVAHMAQLAVSTRDTSLAAALLTILDGFQKANRPFTTQYFAEAFGHEEFLKVREYLKIAEHRFQGTVIAVRTWLADKANPLHSVGLALMGRTLDEAAVKSLEVIDGSSS